MNVEPQVEAALAAARQRSRRRAQRDRVSSIFWPALAIAIALTAWELWIRLRDVPLYIMAPFSTVSQAVVERRGLLLHETWVTLQEALLGFVAAVVVGILIAVLMDASRRVAEAVTPFLVASQVVPVIALAPAIIVWFGYGLTPRVGIVMLFGVFVVTIECLTGLRSLEVEKVYLARSIGAGRLRSFFSIQLPHALPNLLSGIKLASMFCLTGAVVAEFVASQEGLGHYIMYRNSLLDNVGVASGVVYIVAAGLTLFLVVSLIERLAIPWHTSRRSSTTGSL